MTTHSTSKLIRSSVRELLQEQRYSKTQWGMLTDLGLKSVAMGICLGLGMSVEDAERETLSWATEQEEALSEPSLPFHYDEEE